MTVDELAEGVLRGDRRLLARAMTLVENRTPRGRHLLRLLYPHSGRAHTVGVTGSAGSGKSTLTGALTHELRRRGKTVGIIAVDPTSPFTSGAILGDRIRMQDLTGDHDVFMRSVATRGSLGGLSEAVADLMCVLDAAGKDVVIVETVGAGQDEVEVARTAQTTVLVLTPGTGDDIQAMKAGIMEIADILVVNKADLPGADTLLGHLRALLMLNRAEGWQVPVQRAIASREEGVVELADAIEQRRRFLETSGALETARRERARHQLLAAMRSALIRRAVGESEGVSRLEEAVERVASREIDPHTAAEELIEQVRER